MARLELIGSRANMNTWLPSKELWERIDAGHKFSMADLAKEVDRLSEVHLDFVIFLATSYALKASKRPHPTKMTFTLASQLLRYFLGVTVHP
jgi:hypothetical protein